MQIPPRFSRLNGLICGAEPNGSIPLNSLIFEGENIVTAYNAVAEQRDDLAEALRDLSYASKYTRANHYKSEFGLRAAEDKADALLAKLK